MIEDIVPTDPASGHAPAPDPAPVTVPAATTDPIEPATPVEAAPEPAPAAEAVEGAAAVESSAESTAEPEAPAEEVAAADEEPAEPAAADEGAPPEEAPAPEESHKRWYVVKVQSGREDTIKEAIERRVRKEGVEDSFGQIVIPVEKVTEFKVDKNGKRTPKTRERKLYPGYLFVEVEYNDRIVYLFRETSGVGDFVGAHPGDLTKAPTPMADREVQRILGTKTPGGPEGAAAAAPVSPKPKWLQEGERVKVADGTFNGMEGTIKQINEATSKVQVELTIFGRPVAIELEYFQVEQV